MSQTQTPCVCRLLAGQSQGMYHSSLGMNTEQRAGEVRPLIGLSAGASARIFCLRGKSDMIRHLTELGFVENTEIKVISRNAGNLIVELRGSRLAIGCQMASHIDVIR